MLRDLQQRVRGEREEEVENGLRRRLLRKPSEGVNLTVGQILQNTEQRLGGEGLPLPEPRYGAALDPTLHQVLDLPQLSSHVVGWCARHVPAGPGALDHRRRWTKGRVQCDLVKYAHDYEAVLGTNPYSGKPMFPSK